MSVTDRRAQAQEINAQDLDVMLSLARGPKVDMIPHAQGAFGYSETNPIPVDDQLGQVEYLACLRCQCNASFDFHRLGSAGIGPDGHMVDKYEVACKTRKHSHVLYMDMYHMGKSSLVPEGMSWGEPEGDGMPIYVPDFPEGLSEAFQEEIEMSELPGAEGMVTRQFSERATCMHCKQEQDFTIYSMINGEQSPELREKILAYELTVLTCPYCDEKTDIGYTFFYYDPKTQMQLYYTPGEEELEPFFADKMLALMGPGARKTYKDYHCRIVKNRFELADKIRVFEDGLDDRIIEVLKLYVLIARDELAGSNERFLYYEEGSGKRLDFLSLGESDAGVTKLARKGYEELHEDLIEQLQDVNSIRGKYLQVDRNYALDCLGETNREKKKSSVGIFSRVTSWFRGD